MKSIFQINRNRGVGLIEVLITTVVIGVGLLALASMQGGLMSETGASKTRAEALGLAEQKIEELRNYISRGQFDAVTDNSDPSPGIIGINATFDRAWDITPNDPTGSQIIDLTVRVWWGNQADQQVALSSQIAYVEPSNTAGLASGRGEVSHLTGPGVAAPHPNVRSSERALDIQEILNADNSVKSGFSQVEGYSNLYRRDSTGEIYRLDGGGSRTGRLVDYISNLTAFDIDLRYEINNATPAPENPIRLYTKRVNLDEISGNEAIELYTANMINGIGDGENMLNADAGSLVSDGTATRVHRYFGGVILSMKGVVHTVNNLDDIKIDHNREDMFCVFNPGQNQSSRQYACYPGGNCSASEAGDNADVTRCPDPSAADSTVGIGGWRGNVGLINVDDDGGGKESVCYLEEILNQESARSTARKYKGLASGVEQGVNQSYSCQDFLIVGRRENFNQLAAACATAASGNLSVASLPPKEITRTIIGANTVVVGVNNTYCNNLAAKNYNLSIAVTGGTAYTIVKVSGGTAIVTCTGGPTAYTCSGQTRANVLTVNTTDSSTNAAGSCSIELNTSNTPATGSCSITPVSPPIYTLNGTIICPTNKDPNAACKSNLGATIKITDDFTVFDKPCTSTSSSFSCQIQTNYSTARILGSKVGNQTPYCTAVGLNAAPGESVTINNVCTLKY